jgi:uncharacterized membrane protein
MNKEQWPAIVNINPGGSPMPKGKFFVALVILMVIVLLIGAIVSFTNIKYAQEGTVQVVTKWGAI